MLNSFRTTSPLLFDWFDWRRLSRPFNHPRFSLAVCAYVHPAINHYRLAPDDSNAFEETRWEFLYASVRRCVFVTPLSMCKRLHPFSSINSCALIHLWLSWNTILLHMNQAGLHLIVGHFFCSESDFLFYLVLVSSLYHLHAKHPLPCNLHDRLESTYTTLFSETMFSDLVLSYYPSRSFYFFS